MIDSLTLDLDTMDFTYPASRDHHLHTPMVLPGWVCTDDYEGSGEARVVAAQATRATLQNYIRDQESRTTEEGGTIFVDASYSLVALNMKVVPICVVGDDQAAYLVAMALTNREDETAFEVILPSVFTAIEGEARRLSSCGATEF